MARALALFGMVIVNYQVVLSYEQFGPWSVPADLLTGRAAALFVILAGIGTSLAHKRISNTPGKLRLLRLSLLKRAAFLWVAGWVFVLVWPADILHYYGVFLLVGALVIRTPSSAILAMAVLGILLSLGFLLYGNYLAHWDLVTLEYQDLWTLDGFARNLFLNGFHPILPWLSFYLFGMMLGRLDWQARRTRRLSFAWGIFLFFVAKSGSVLMGTSLAPMPPTPFFVVGGIGTALMTIAASFWLADTMPSALRQRLTATGRLAFTHYIAHVVIGLGIIEEAWGLGPHSPGYALLAALVYAAVAVELSWQWQKRWGAGPIERLFRRVTL